jgi:hypothetical protein
MEPFILNKSEPAFNGVLFLVIFKHGFRINPGIVTGKDEPADPVLLRLYPVFIQRELAGGEKNHIADLVFRRVAAFPGLSSMFRSYCQVINSVVGIFSESPVNNGMSIRLSGKSFRTEFFQRRFIFLQLPLKPGSECCIETVLLFSGVKQNPFLRDLLSV